MRLPRPRCVSEYMVMVRRKKALKKTTSRLPKFAEYSEQECGPQRAGRYMSLVAQPRVDDVVSQFHFVGIAERHDESVIVLASLLGVQPEQLSQNAFRPGTGMLSAPGLPGTPPGASSFDLDLYAAANASLDVHIRAIGRRRFQTALDKFRSSVTVGHGPSCLNGGKSAW